MGQLQKILPRDQVREDRGVTGDLCDMRVIGNVGDIACQYSAAK